MKKYFPYLLGGIVIIVVLSYFLFGQKSASSGPTATPTKVPAAPVNQIPVTDRPYVVLQPLTGRNEIQITLTEPKVAAKTVEVALEYDRNKGVLDAVLKQFVLAKFPYQDNLFLGSKSAGGHITYHEDVIGGKLVLTFDGAGRRYALENPWRYADTEKNYPELSTADGKFQVQLNPALASPKVIVMQSPGLPAPVSGEVIAGPYLFRGVGALPKSELNLKIRLNDETADPKLYGWDGKAWQNLPLTLEGKTVAATTPTYEAFVVAK